jgi:hypothetical protein
MPKKSPAEKLAEQVLLQKPTDEADAYRIAQLLLTADPADATPLDFFSGNHGMTRLELSLLAKAAVEILYRPTRIPREVD